MSLIVDASVAAKWFIEELGSDRARVIADAVVSAPDLIFLEVFNAVRKRMLLGEVLPEQLDKVVPVLKGTLADVAATGGLIEEACWLSRDLSHPVYDCVYIAMARRLGMPLVTADERQLVAARAARAPARPL